MKQIHHQQQEEFDLDAYREEWRQDGERMVQNPWLTDVELVKLITQAQFSQALRRKRFFSVAAAACLVLGFGVAAFFFLLPQDSGFDRGEVAQNKPIVCRSLPQGDSVVEDELPLDLAQVKSNEVEQAAPQVADKVVRKSDRKVVVSNQIVENTEVMCNSSCDSGAVLGQIRAFLLDREV